MEYCDGLLTSRRHLGVLLLATGNLDLAISILDRDSLGDRISEGREIFRRLSSDKLCEETLFASNRAKARVLVDAWDSVWDSQFQVHSETNLVELQLCSEACGARAWEMFQLGMWRAAKSVLSWHLISLKVVCDLKVREVCTLLPTSWRCDQSVPNSTDLILWSKYALPADRMFAGSWMPSTWMAGERYNLSQVWAIQYPGTFAERRIWFAEGSYWGHSYQRGQWELSCDPETLREFLVHLQRNW